MSSIMTAYTTSRQALDCEQTADAMAFCEPSKIRARLLEWATGRQLGPGVKRKAAQQRT